MINHTKEEWAYLSSDITPEEKNLYCSFISAVEDNNLKDISSSISEFEKNKAIFSGRKMPALILDAAIEGNNKNEVEVSIIERLIVSNVVDIAPYHHQNTKNSSLRMALAAQSVN